MVDFAYIARNVTGQRVEGTLSAGSEREAIATLAAQEMFPVEVSVAAGQTLKRGNLKVRPQAMSQFYTQLSALLRSGVPLLRSLDVLQKTTSLPALQQILEDLHARVTEGDSLAESMARHPRAFSELATSIVRAGGEGGFLEEALERVAKFTDQQAELKSKVMGAMAYPIFLAVFGTGIVTVLIIFFVPKFEKLFTRLRAKGELPILTDCSYGSATRSAITDYSLPWRSRWGCFLCVVSWQLIRAVGFSTVGV